MATTTSLSKGCYAYVPKSSKSRSKKQKRSPDEFEEFNSIPRLAAYSSLMSSIEKELKKINNNASDEVLQELVKFVLKCPLNVCNSHYSIPTAVLLTGVNLPDHHVMFDALAERLKVGVTKHVAVLLSSECSSVKNTVEQLTSQFLRGSTTDCDSDMDLDESDSEEDNEKDNIKRSECNMSHLVSWHKEICSQPHSPKKEDFQSYLQSHKLVIIFPDFEGFSPKVLQDVILILSGYLDRLPLVLVLGVATSLTALQSALPHRVTSRLNVHMFQSKPSVHFLNTTVNDVFLSRKISTKCPFLLGTKIFKFLTDVFIFYDFSVNGFIQGVKYCLMEHFYNSKWSRLCCSKKEIQGVVEDLNEEEMEAIKESKTLRTYVENLSQAKKNKIFKSEDSFKELIVTVVTDLQRHKHHLLVAVWMLHTLVHDLPQAPLGEQVRDVYTEVMSGPITEHPKFHQCFGLLNFKSKEELLQKVNEMKNILLESKCLEDVQEKLNTLHEALVSAGQSIKSPSASPSKRRTLDMCSSREQLKQQLRVKSIQIQNEFEQARSNILNYLKDDVFPKYLVSPSKLPLHEVMLIDNMSDKKHIVGAPRAALHVALNNPHHYLKCKCCKISNNAEIVPTMPDICIAYKLHLESSTHINMYDWLQSFVTIVSPGDVERDERKVDPELQARFTRAVAELQFLGFIKASKKKSDHVARLTWGATC